MEVHLNPDVEKQLNDLAAESGRQRGEVLEDAVIGYLNELVQTRELLDERYDELKSGAIEAIPGTKVEAHFRRKSAEARRSRQSRT